MRGTVYLSTEQGFHLEKVQMSDCCEACAVAIHQAIVEAINERRRKVTAGNV